MSGCDAGALETFRASALRNVNKGVMVTEVRARLAPRRGALRMSRLRRTTKEYCASTLVPAAVDTHASDPRHAVPSEPAFEHGVQG